jgi:hypothetical protein
LLRQAAHSLRSLRRKPYGLANDFARNRHSIIQQPGEIP